MENQKPVLLILAAGMGSRYGGLKQMDGFGPSGETIIDYSIYDALKVGFEKIVFVIRNSFAKEFIDRVNIHWAGRAELVFVNQELDHLPESFICPPDRVKPWGTGHAVWVAKDAINGPFGVINADDFYGRNAMQLLYDFLSSGSKNYAVVAYPLINTLSDHGAVNRGICKISEENKLISILECKNIYKQPEIYFEHNDHKHFLNPDTPVSMNMWGFQANYFVWANSFFCNFLQKNLANSGAEFYIPELIQDLIDTHKTEVHVLHSSSSWIGVTYKEDKPMVEKAFNDMIQAGIYPEKL